MRRNRRENTPWELGNGRIAMMYYTFMETLKKNEYFLTRDVAGEIWQSPETSHYRTLTDGEVHNRVHQVIYHTYKRHADFVERGKSGDTMGAWYSRIGQERFEEGFPLEEVVKAFSYIRRRVMRCVEERMHPEEDWSMTQASRLYWSFSLFFDAVTRAVVEGYRKAAGTGWVAEKR
jgi:hypothetical protein